MEYIPGGIEKQVNFWMFYTPLGVAWTKVVVTAKN